MTSRVLLLTPSRGLGGGIERYVDTLEWALTTHGVGLRRIDLHGGGAVAQARMLAQARRHLQGTTVATRLILGHRALLPMAALLARERSACGISVVCHGNDVWGHRPLVRRLVENHLLRNSDVRAVAVSSFTAGALIDGCHARVLSPGLSREWFDTLVNESFVVKAHDAVIRLLTIFRLDQWQAKGLRELLRAVSTLGRAEITVTVCGSGKPSSELQLLVRQNPFCSLLTRVSDRELARLFAEADLFVLATRTQGGRHPSGEGFGLVLLEAQIAGTPVVGPAFGGSCDAYIDGVTGIAPTDETADALAKVLDELLRDPSRLEKMGKRAAEWARECFAPELYASRVIRRLL
jgi:phosphatidyl-myo-inositol dimannoside synthase